MNKTSIYFFMICFASLGCSNTDAQEISTLEFMPYDTAAFVYIEAPDECAQFLDHSMEFDAPFFDELVKILFDDKPPEEWDFDKEKFENWKDRLVDSMESFESLTFIVTSTNPLRYRVVFRGEPDKCKFLSDLIRSSFELLNKALESPEPLFSNFDGPWFSHAQPDPFAENQEEIEPLSLFDDEGDKPNDKSCQDTYERGTYKESREFYSDSFHHHSNGWLRWGQPCYSFLRTLLMMSLLSINELRPLFLSL